MACRIVLLHATPVAMEPIRSAFAQRWPEAEPVNLLDDALTIDRAREAELSEAMIDRFVAFGLYGQSLGAAGILVTCSAFGPAVDRLAARCAVPVLKPNQAMFEAAAAHGRRIGMLATFAPSVATMTDEFDRFVAESGRPATLETIVVDGAMAALRRGDAEAHNRLIAARAAALVGCDAIMLAHFSTSRAFAAVSEAVSVPVLSAPELAVDRIRALVTGPATA
ncbi:aspartate/glutamate racemase family protein [Lichenicoccus sp.]|uniref:aspartate/glutamate racemase family protein n=1 Tax=Lichenicoccus sp. TaxID=2781899 RepID=UPI003D0F0742